MRLNGWKRIAAYFGRDRTTVARWAKERNLPVHHIPGGKQRSVFAFEDELAAWAQQNADAQIDLNADAQSASAPSPTPSPSVTAAPRNPLRIFILIVALAALVAAFAYGAYSSSKKMPAPASAEAMSQYLTARDFWARRTPADIRQSIALFEVLIQREPNFALARAGLADAWLIYREYGEVSDARAYGIARIAAQKALSIDPDLPAAHRALGFIDYWWDNDPIAAIKEFKRAIELDGRDGQTHFWYANVLADLGEDEAAERHYAQARLLSPGSQAVAVEYACAQWQAGRDDLALKMMTELKTRYPDDATVRNCLSWIYIGRGDIRNFSAEFAQMARLRKEPKLLGLSEKIEQAVRRDPATAHRVLIEDAHREIATGTRRIREVPAFYASSMGDRASLVDLMREAKILGERWHSPGITSRIAKRWKGDAEVIDLLSDLRIAPPNIANL